MQCDGPISRGRLTEMCPDRVQEASERVKRQRPTKCRHSRRLEIRSSTPELSPMRDDPLDRTAALAQPETLQPVRIAKLRRGGTRR